MESVLIYTVQSGPIWDWRVVVDLFCGGVGVGAFLLAVALSRSEDVQRLKLAQTAAFTGPVMVIVGLLFLFTKLGNQLNVHQMILNVAPTSIMWLGFLLQGALVLCGLIYAWQWRDINARSGRNTMGCLVGVLAVTVGIYHGVLLGALTARPLWANGSMLFLSVSIFLSTGIAGALLIHYIRMGASGDGAAMRPVFVALAVSLMVTMIALANSWAGLNYGSLASQQALAAASDTYGTMLCGVGVGMGLILPLILLMPVLRRRDEYGGLSLPVIALACLLVLVGGFATRYVVVLGGQLPPPIATLS
jgi:formate-dependent nitrite reductase membrane component NrfD